MRHASSGLGWFAHWRRIQQRSYGAHARGDEDEGETYRRRFRVKRSHSTRLHKVIVADVYGRSTRFQFDAVFVEPGCNASDRNKELPATDLNPWSTGSFLTPSHRSSQRKGTFLFLLFDVPRIRECIWAMDRHDQEIVDFVQGYTDDLDSVALTESIKHHVSRPMANGTVANRLGRRRYEHRDGTVANMLVALNFMTESEVVKFSRFAASPREYGQRTAFAMEILKKCKVPWFQPPRRHRPKSSI